MNATENKKIFQSKSMFENNDLEEITKQNFEYWHKKYMDSPLNYPLVWKKAMESNFEIMKKIEHVRKKNTKQVTTIQMQQFFDMWSNVIRISNFEIAKKTMQDWGEFWKNATDEEFRTCVEVLQMIQNYWKEIQNKNIE